MLTQCQYLSATQEGERMIKKTPEQIAGRREEIVNACENAHVR